MEANVESCNSSCTLETSCQALVRVAHYQPILIHISVEQLIAKVFLRVGMPKVRAVAKIFGELHQLMPADASLLPYRRRAVTSSCRTIATDHTRDVEITGLPADAMHCKVLRRPITMMSRIKFDFNTKTQRFYLSYNRIPIGFT